MLKYKYVCLFIDKFKKTFDVPFRANQLLYKLLYVKTEEIYIPKEVLLEKKKTFGI